MSILKAVAVFLVLGRPIALLAQTTSPIIADQLVYALNIRATQSEAKVGEPISIDIILTNISNKALGIAFDMAGRSEFTYEVFVDNQQGVEAPYTPYLRALRGKLREPGDPDMLIQSDRKMWIVQPGKAVTTHMDITRLCKIEVPGTYTVWVERLDQSSGIRVRSNTVSLTVNP
jgi:hypothetical protein